MSGVDGEVVGTGNADDCIEQITAYFLLDRCNKLQQQKGCGIAGLYQPFVQESKKIYAVSGVSTAANFFDMDTQDGYAIEDLEDKFKTLCNKSWSTVQQEYPNNSYVITNCFLGLYATTLMTQGYNLSSDRHVYSPSEIDGFEPSWTLGAMFYVVA